MEMRSFGYFSKYIGITTNYIAEIQAIIEGIEQAIQLDWRKFWVVSDSAAAIQAFRTNKVPWRFSTRWSSIREQILSIRFSHVWRETNFTADQMARRGSRGPLEEWSEDRPSYLTKIEDNVTEYFRFKVH
ncbi:hypothetical protein GIB67_017472 [Kingdonia uniflora]|uniref:RNase H type-1 domain-containing protein n=1 Tax=Kingdonia uniflora TaxID=39325 RepID=A0A7J7M4D4_9MAGN|nr:hypothetical protein GIB67_017472 [Kingdonia uniflora]